VEEHATHLEFVLQKLKENKLYANWVKNKFANSKMNFLRCVVLGRGEAQTKEN
jgi:hypothetical protein